MRDTSGVERNGVNSVGETSRVVELEPETSPKLLINAMTEGSDGGGDGGGANGGGGASDSGSVPVEGVSSSDNDGEDKCAGSDICLVCKVHFSKYTCPRCQVRYCSLVCYKQHSNLCTESFYQKNTEEWMRSTRATSSDRVEMERVLHRVYNDESGQNQVDAIIRGDEVSGIEYKQDDDVEAMSEEDQLRLIRLAEALKLFDTDAVAEEHHTRSPANLEDADVEALLAELSPAQKADFERALVDGRLGDMMEPWEPWWCIAYVTLDNLVRSNNRRTRSGDRSDAGFDSVPYLRTSEVTPFRSIAPMSSPSPMIAFHIHNMLFSYVFTLRAFNGCWSEAPFDCFATLVQGSEVLGNNGVFTSPSTAFLSGIECCSRVLRGNPKAMVIHSLMDVSFVLQRKLMVLLALFDMKQVGNAALKESRWKSTKDGEGARAGGGADSLPTAADEKIAKREEKRVRNERKRMMRCVRKIEYMLSWVDSVEECDCSWLTTGRDAALGLYHEKEIAALQPQELDATRKTDALTIVSSKGRADGGQATGQKTNHPQITEL